MVSTQANAQACNRPLRIVFMGTPFFAVPSLLALIASPTLCTVVGVVTQPDRRQGRGQKEYMGATKAVALAHNIATFSFTKFKSPETHDILADLAPDLFVVAAFGRILPQSILDMAPRGAINVHASLLPRHRGASPIAHAVLHGDPQTGVTLMQMDAGLDTGAMLLAQKVPIEPVDTTGSLTDILAHVGGALIKRLLPELVADTVVATPQPKEGVTLAPPLNKAQGALDFNLSAAFLARQIRAFDPWPSSFCFLDTHERVAILDGTAIDAIPLANPQKPGTIVDIQRDGMVVACGSGALKVCHVKPAGRQTMSVGAWIAGRGPKKGATLKGTLG